MAVLFAFVALLNFCSTDALAAATAKNSEAVFENGDSDGTYFIEKDVNEPVIKKHKKFPFLIVGVGVVVAAVAVYFLFIKKPKYTLNVTVGDGVDGSPPNGSTTHKKGSQIAYNYSSKSGYENIQVKLDNLAVASSGTINMDKDHTLTASANRMGSLLVQSSPSGASVYLNGQLKGNSTLVISDLASGSYTVKLSKSGYDKYETTVQISSNQQTTCSTTLQKDLRGNYTGKTNQDKDASVNVIRSSEQSKVNSCVYSFKTPTNSRGYYVSGTATITGTTTVSGYKFSATGKTAEGMTLGMSGTFYASNTQLNGLWSFYWNSYSYGIFDAKGTYTASKSGSAGASSERDGSESNTITLDLIKDGTVVQTIKEKIISK